MSETRSCSQWAYEGEVKKWAEEVMESELSEMTGSLEQLGVWEELRCVGVSEKCGGRGVGVSERWRTVVGVVEDCGGRGKVCRVRG